MFNEEIVKPENLVYKKTDVLTDAVMHYCPGCPHGTIHRIIAEVIEEMGIQDKAIGIAPVGCSVLAYNYFNVDFVEAAHGRAPALASAIQRLHPDHHTFTYQGDGDLAAIGTAETIHACNRGENIIIFFVNNAIYGMTGGQMAPTTLVGMQSATTPYGRRVDLNGWPLQITELVAQLPGTYYVTGDTYARSEITGEDEFFQFIVPKAKLTAEQTITLEAEGDPSTFSMNLTVLRPESGEMMQLVQYDLEAPAVSG